ncbi:TPA: cation transporter, partial [Pseudomonas aeruginosa]|nr:cation transporter [Pseudomonas aeruginosa]
VKRVDAVLREQFSIEHATIGIDWNSDAVENICSLQPTTGRDDHSGHDHSAHDHSGHKHGSGHDHGAGHRDGDGHDHDHSAPGHKH